MGNRERFEELRKADPAQVDELDSLWAELDVASVEEMIGHWSGGDFATGHPASKLLDAIGWHGKWMDSRSDVTPIVVRGQGGALEANSKAAGGGEASLWSIEFRGEYTATMVYDAMPVFDHFKKVDADTVVGVMNGKLEAAFGSGELYYFWLEREK
ncbi:DUF4334 domain-containing protein [Dietzia sp.]|uniref:DUF4334 domain-containing protein n=1 Tax=Dietzia sp. TaxID=1871616 RepID=UPI002FD9351A